MLLYSTLVMYVHNKQHLTLVELIIVGVFLKQDRQLKSRSFPFLFFVFFLFLYWLHSLGQHFLKLARAAKLKKGEPTQFQTSLLVSAAAVFSNAV